jgi:LPS O-antigen subunit length determinant protein (WzzB/FepE family)
VSFLYRGRRERPLTRVERRQLLVLAVAKLVGLVVAIVGVILWCHVRTGSARCSC